MRVECENLAARGRDVKCCTRQPCARLLVFRQPSSEATLRAYAAAAILSSGIGRPPEPLKACWCLRSPSQRISRSRAKRTSPDNTARLYISWIRRSIGPVLPRQAFHRLLAAGYLSKFRVARALLSGTAVHHSRPSSAVPPP